MTFILLCIVAAAMIANFVVAYRATHRRASAPRKERR